MLSVCHFALQSGQKFASAALGFAAHKNSTLRIEKKPQNINCQFVLKSLNKVWKNR